MAGGKTHLVLREEDVVKLACEFMERREMNIAQIALERYHYEKYIHRYNTYTVPAPVL
jgi:hypothetical protein